MADKNNTQPTTSSQPASKGRIKSLFQSAVKKIGALAPDGTQQQLVPSIETADNWQNLREGETYHNYGKRICARATAAKYTFSAFLQKIYNIERQAQMNNVELQEQLKNDVRARISGMDEQVNQENGRINQLLITRQSLKNKVATSRSELQELKADNGQVNRNAKVKLYIGGFILILLTLYLFIFYSSTFYSAFFKDFMAAGSTSVGTHMFDSQAISASLSAGVGQLVFVLSAPIIFLGLGFALHYFSKEEGAWKILKIIAVIVVTFIFDCILAYSISKNIYTIISMSSLEEMPEYTVNTAMTDHNVWAVIFCGFIVYIIWGVVFSLTMTAYEELKSNRNEQIKVQGIIDSLDAQIQDNELQENEIKTSVARLEREKKILTQTLNNQCIVHNGPIKVAMNDFNAGWMSMMAALDCSLEMQNEVHSIYEENMHALFPLEPDDNQILKQK